MTNVHSFVNTHFGCFHILAIVNNPALNIGLQISFQMTVFVFFGSPEMELLDHIVALFLIFEEPRYTCSQALHSTPLLYTPNSGAQGPLFSPFQLTLVICCLFESSHSDRCGVLAPCGFDLHFPDDQQCSVEKAMAPHSSTNPNCLSYCGCLVCGELCFFVASKISGFGFQCFCTMMCCDADHFLLILLEFC